jgi:hypothetical protein
MRRLALLVGLLVTAAYACAGTFPIAFLGSSGGEWQNGHPHYATFRGTGEPAYLMCAGWAHGGALGTRWQADVTGAGWILPQTRFTPSNQRQSMNYAEWHIAEPGVPLSSLAQSWLNQASAEAVKGFSGVNFNPIDTLTPVNRHDSDPIQYMNPCI